MKHLLVYKKQIWNGTKTEFDDFFKKINECDPSSINFLDTTVFKVDNKLQIKMYVKATNRQSYLHSKSEHPNSIKKGIAYSQSLRFNKYSLKLGFAIFIKFLL